MRRLWMAGLALAIAAAGAAPALAAVQYDYTSTNGAFSYTAPDFIAADLFVPAGDLDSCTPSVGFTCQFASFSYANGLDRVIFTQTDGGSTKSDQSYFPADSFLTAGTFFATAATLTVSVVDDPVGVPEPATWTMMIAGFAGVGGLMRRRRASVAAV